MLLENISLLFFIDGIKKPLLTDRDVKDFRASQIEFKSLKQWKIIGYTDMVSNLKELPFQQLTNYFYKA